MHAPLLPAPAAPPPPPLGGPHRFTVLDFYRMVDVGVLRSDARVELLDGGIYDLVPIDPFHSGVGTRLQRIFERLPDPDRWTVRGRYPIRLDDGSEPLPDLALVRPREDFYATDHPTPADVFLLVEVADSSLRFDREKKLPLYARAGIAGFWLVNLVARNVEVYRRPDGSGVYAESFLAIGTDPLAPATFPDAGLTVAQLLGGVPA